MSTCSYTQCAVLGISCGTLNAWLILRRETGSTHLRPRPKTRRSRKIDEQKLKASIAAHSDAYWREIAAEFGVSAVVMGLRAKKDDTLCQAFQETRAELDTHQIVGVDECRLGQGLYRVHARSPRGVPVLADIHDRRFAPRISVIAAYNQHHLQATLRFEGSTDTDVFNTWVEHCLVPTLQPDQVVIMDNACFHQSSKTRELIEAADLNKIEHQWAVLKQGIRASLDPDLSFLEKLDQQVRDMYEP